MGQKFQYTQTITLLVSVVSLMAIPVLGLAVTIFMWDGYCLFGTSCTWWESAGLMMAVISTVFFPLSVGLFLVWLIMLAVQTLTPTRERKLPKLSIIQTKKLLYYLCLVFFSIIVFLVVLLVVRSAFV